MLTFNASDRFDFENIVGKAENTDYQNQQFMLAQPNYSFLGFMLVIVAGFIPLLWLSIGLTMDMMESSQWLGKNIVRSTA